MKRSRQKVCACVLWACVCVTEFGTVSPASGGDKAAAKTILDAMLESANKVKNIRCKAEYLDWSSPATRQEEYDRLLKAGRSEAAALTRKREFVAYRYGFTFDNQGRLRIEELQATGDAHGNIIDVDLDDTCTWDGEVSMYLYRRGLVTQGRITNQKPPSVVGDYQDPADIFRSSFQRTLQTALSREDSDVRVRTESGSHHVEILWKGKTKAVGVIDPACGYSVPRMVLYGSSGRPLFTCEARYREVAPGIWYPVEGVKLVGTPESPAHKRTVKVTEVKINDPNFTDEAFRIDFPAGTQVHDSTTGLSYVVREPQEP